MTWELRFSPRAAKQLGKLDRHQAALIIGWLEKNVQGCEDPRAHGKVISHGRSDQWRYRIGDYRVLCDTQDSVLVVLALEVGHRSTVYKRG